MDTDAVVYFVDPPPPFTRASSASSSSRTPTKKQLVCYGFYDYPGVYWYPQVLAPDVQQRLAYAALTEYCEVEQQPSSLADDTTTTTTTTTTAPTGYRTNIDLVPPKPHERINSITSNNNTNESMWEVWKQEQHYHQRQNCPTNTTIKRKTTSPPRPQYYRRLEKLAWSTLGYHYDWTARSYNPHQRPVLLPPFLTQLSRFFVDRVRPTRSVSSLYRPSAAIVNYYTVKATMGRHRDDLEHPLAWDQPIVSMSVGLSGIFLLGGTGTTEEEKETAEGTKAPTTPPRTTTTRALLLRPGDVLLMGGPSRLNYHALARVVPDDALRQYDYTWRRRRSSSSSSSSMETSATTSSPLSSSPCSRCTNPHGNDVITIQDIQKFTAATTTNDDDDDVNDNCTNTTTNWNNTKHNSSTSTSSDAEDPNRIDARETEYVNDYLKQHRININVRQVYPSPTTTTAGE